RTADEVQVGHQHAHREGARARHSAAAAVACRRGHHVKRRLFLASMVALPAFAQSRAPRIGFLNSAVAANYTFNAQAFREGLRESGYAEGQNVAIEYRWAEGDYSRLPQLAQELVRNDVDVIAATGDVASARAAMAATSTIPIVFTVGADPVA